MATNIWLTHDFFLIRKTSMFMFTVELFQQLHTAGFWKKRQIQQGTIKKKQKTPKRFQQHSHQINPSLICLLSCNQMSCLLCLICFLLSWSSETTQWYVTTFNACWIFFASDINESLTEFFFTHWKKVKLTKTCSLNWFHCQIKAEMIFEGHFNVASFIYFQVLLAKLSYSIRLEGIHRLCFDLLNSRGNSCDVHSLFCKVHVLQVSITWREWLRKYKQVSTPSLFK